MPQQSNDRKIASNYERDGLLEKIGHALQALGRAPDDVDLHVLGAVDEFHVGGRSATEKIVKKLQASSQHRVLDIGCGLGGPARFISNATGCQVDGVDLTASYIDAGNRLSDWVGMRDTVTLIHGSALELPFDDEIFDAAYMIHVGMNIEDKLTLMKQALRVLKPGGRFVIYDVMLPKPAEVDYPLPWAEHETSSFLQSPEGYVRTLAEAGFAPSKAEDLTDFAIAFFAQVAAGRSQGPSPLGLHLLLGDTASQKLQNIARQIHMRRLSPTLLIGHKS